VPSLDEFDLDDAIAIDFLELKNKNKNKNRHPQFKNT